VRWFAAFLLALLCVVPAFAQTPAEMRAQTLLTILKSGKVDPVDFTPPFLSQVPAARVEAIATQLTTQNGAVLGIASLKPRDATEADVVFDYPDARVTAQFAVESSAPHRFIGLFITGVARKDDSFAKIVAALRALNGVTALRMTRLDSTSPPLVDHNGETAMATASTFKLFVLEALVTEIEAKRRTWADVVPLGAPSLPSGVTQDWPRGTAVTLQTLATQMISISDNSATDTLMLSLGFPRSMRRGRNTGLRPVRSRC